MFENLLTSDIGRTAIVPFGVAFALALIVRAVGGRGLGHRLAAIGIGAGFFVAYYLIDGIPAFLPAATKDKVFYVAAAGLALGVVLDLAGLTRAGGHLLAFVLPAGALYWLRQNQIVPLWMPVRASFQISPRIGRSKTNSIRARRPRVCASPLAFSLIFWKHEPRGLDATWRPKDLA